MFLLSIHVTSLTLLFHLSEPVNKMYIMWLQLSIWQGMYSNSFLQSLFIFHLLFCTNSNCIFFSPGESLCLFDNQLLSFWVLGIGEEYSVGVASLEIVLNENQPVCTTTFLTFASKGYIVLYDTVC